MIGRIRGDREAGGVVADGPGPESVPPAVSVLVPEVSIRRLVNAATPATAATVVVPWSEPVPLRSETVTLTVESAPVVTAFPNWSLTVTTGWVPNAAPAVAPEG